MSIKDWKEKEADDDSLGFYRVDDLGIHRGYVWKEEDGWRGAYDVIKSGIIFARINQSVSTKELMMLMVDLKLIEGGFILENPLGFV
tara:strand:+ start:407 stop:667 length:261 start_codon:yes stop_codon:yes gene_type:complete